jgi:hypothetical protein
VLNVESLTTPVASERVLIVANDFCGDSTVGQCFYYGRIILIASARDALPGPRLG